MVKTLSFGAGAWRPNAGCPSASRKKLWMRSSVASMTLLQVADLSSLPFTISRLSSPPKTLSLPLILPWNMAVINLMKHRDRILMALSHEEPDRCPMQVSFTPEFADRLRLNLQLKGDTVHNPHGGGNTYELDRALGEDMLLTSVGWVNSYYRPGYDRCDSYVDEWGVTWRTVEYKTPFGTGRYTEPAGHPLADANAVAGYRPPDPARPELYEYSSR